MKERPILFSGVMVRAILAGEKWQTRRVVKPQPVQHEDGTWHATGRPASGYGSEQTMRDFLPLYCPYGQPGDRLWVRETYCANLDTDGDISGVCCYRADKPDEAHPGSFTPRATEIWDSVGHTGWRPSIHMPRWASRITLEITSVRVERVQDISRADEEAEGVQPFREDAPDELPPGIKFRAFSALWDEINAERHYSYSWGNNPWVWVIEFKRIVP